MLLAWRWFFRVARTGFWLLRAPCGSPCLCAGSLREMRLWPELTHVCDWAGLSVLLLGHVSRSMEPSAKNFRLGWFHFWVYLLIATVLLIIFFNFHQRSPPWHPLQAGECSSGANLGAERDLFIFFLPLQWLGLSDPFICASGFQFYMVQVLFPREWNPKFSYQPELWGALVHFKPSEA